MARIVTTNKPFFHWNDLISVELAGIARYLLSKYNDKAIYIVDVTRNVIKHTLWISVRIRKVPGKLTRSQFEQLKSVVSILLISIVGWAYCNCQLKIWMSDRITQTLQSDSTRNWTVSTLGLASLKQQCNDGNRSVRNEYEEPYEERQQVSIYTSGGYSPL